MVLRFGTGRSVPASGTVASIRAHFIDAPNEDNDSTVRWIVTVALLRATVATDEWKDRTFVDVLVTVGTGVRRWTHATILAAVQIVARGILMAWRQIARVLFHTRAVPIFNRVDVSLPLH